MKEQGQRAMQLQQAKQRMDMAAAGNTAAAAAAAAVLDALVEGAQGSRARSYMATQGGNAGAAASDLQQGINRLVALLEGSSLHNKAMILPS